MPVEVTPMNQESAPSALARGILLRHHAFLRKQLVRAIDFNSALVLERRQPLCAILLPLYRLFEQLRDELEDYLELEDADLFPSLLELDAGRFPAADVAETIRLLKYGQAALSSVMSEMREITQGFLAPPGGCASYVGLLHVLAAIRTELLLQFQLENDQLFPDALRLARRQHPVPEPRGTHRPLSTAGLQ